MPTTFAVNYGDHQLLGSEPALQVTPERPLLRIAGYRRRRPLWGVEALTPAEMRVACHAAVGMSNPEIAALLFVTRGTVESQLHAVYRKLGIAGRHLLPGELGMVAADSV